MSLKAYEDACLRAELFGQPKPDKDEFLEKHKYLDVNEFEDVDIKISENTAILNDGAMETNGALGDLNTLLTSTHSKLNRLKGVCGTVTNYFRIKMSAKDLSYSSEPSYVGQTNYDKDFAPTTSSDFSAVNTGLGPKDNEMTFGAGIQQNGGDINSAIDDLKAMQKAENSSFGLLQ